ncbi:acyl carrier protein [Nitratireductor sp. XY-223]|uniref:acyl carrier protein n=1 Tax=Nitratireductor sp. XY-223 TaxID=2561926 RepID=UPI0010AA9C47|nr:acyl carrier protein [Nitratireductor sp. XY-223]
MDPDTARQQIRDKIVALAEAIGNEADGLGDDAFIPQLDILDSAATMELIMWLEQTYRISIPDDDLTIENFGTINLIIGYVTKNA